MSPHASSITTLTQKRLRNSTDYAELHCITNYSFLRGASHPEELVEQAAKLGYSAIAITDECSMAGVVKAHVAAKDCNLKLIVGSEFHFDSNLPRINNAATRYMPRGQSSRQAIKNQLGTTQESVHLILLAPNRTAYGQICNLITIGRRRANKGEYQLDLDDLAIAQDQCLAIWLPSSRNHDSPDKRIAEKLSEYF